MKYHLVRHAQTDANSQGLLSCENSEALNAEGQRQAQRLSEYLLTQSFSAIWVSPIPRAIATIQPYCQASAQGYELMPLLAEGSYNLDPKAGVTCPVYGKDGLPVSDESVDMFRGRVQQFTELVLNNVGSDSVLVITHGQFIREFLNMFLDASRYVRWPVNNCSETLIDVSGDVFIRHVNRDVIQQDPLHSALALG